MFTEDEKKLFKNNFAYEYANYDCNEWFNHISYWYFEENRNLSYVIFYEICNSILKDVCKDIKNNEKYKNVKEEDLPKNIDEVLYINMMVCDLLDAGISYSNFLEFMNTSGSNKEVYDFIYKYIYERILCFI